jgi:hypothetical protein
VGGDFSGDGIVDNHFDPYAAGAGVHTITYSFTTQAGCTGVATDDIYVDDCSGVNEIDGIALNIYPNPSDDVINIQIAGGVPQDLRIYNSIGDLVYAGKGNISGSMNAIDVADFASGVYQVVVVPQKGNAVTAQLVIR